MNSNYIDFAKTLEQVINNNSLSFEHATDVMTQVMQGNLNNEALAALLIALRMKGETTIELTAFAKVMQKFSNKVELKDRNNLVDIVGTGGDGLHTFNISTTTLENPHIGADLVPFINNTILFLLRILFTWFSILIFMLILIGLKSNDYIYSKIKIGKKECL